jgi:hypothetical protein
MKRHSVRWAIKQAKAVELELQQRAEDDAVALEMERVMELAEKRRRWKADLMRALDEMDRQPIRGDDPIFMNQQDWDDIVKDPDLVGVPSTPGGSDV